VLEDRLAPAIQTWTGLGHTNLWSDSGNWARHQVPAGGGLFFDGDDLVFPAGAKQTTNFNDFSDDTAFRSITIQGSGYDLQGHRVALLTPEPTPDILATNPSGSNQIDFDINFGTPLPLPFPGALATLHAMEVDAASASLTLTGEIRGVVVAFDKFGAGKLVLTGTSDYDGLTQIDAGVLNVRNGAALGSTFVGVLEDDSTTTLGGTLELQGGITTAEQLNLFNVNNVTSLRNVSGNNTVTGAVLLDAGTAVEVGSFGRLTLTGPVGDLTFRSGSLDKQGSGTLVLDAANSYSGATTVEAGQLIVENDTALGSTQPGTTVQGGAALLASGTRTIAEPVTLAGVTGNPAALGAQSGSTVFWNGPINLTGPGLLKDTASSSQLILTGGVSGSGGLVVGAAGTIIPAFSSAEVDLTVTAATYTGPTVVNVGNLQLNTALTNSTVTVGGSGATFGGIGTLPDLIDSSGTVAPGTRGINNPFFPQGTLAVTDNVALGSAATFHVDLSGTGFILSHGELRVANLVNLGNPKLDVALHFNSAVNDTFTIIDNEGGQDVIGTFAGLPQDGSTFTVTDPNGNQEKFSITYHGINGHSVVIQHIDTSTMVRDLAVTPLTGRSGEVALTGALVDPDPLDRLTLVVDWGDSTPAQTFHPGTEPFRLHHHYREEGTYTLHVSWFDDHGQGNNRDLTVTVTQRGKDRDARDAFFIQLGGNRDATDWLDDLDRWAGSEAAGGA
jgi:autotransporter-associated beta strand protein